MAGIGPVSIWLWFEKKGDDTLLPTANWQCGFKKGLPMDTNFSPLGSIDPPNVCPMALVLTCVQGRDEGHWVGRGGKGADERHEVKCSIDNQCAHHQCRIWTGGYRVPSTKYRKHARRENLRYCYQPLAPITRVGQRHVSRRWLLTSRRAELYLAGPSNFRTILRALTPRTTRDTVEPSARNSSISCKDKH